MTFGSYCICMDCDAAGLGVGKDQGAVATAVAHYPFVDFWVRMKKAAHGGPFLLRPA
jgi:hypothetical protein